MAWDFYAMCMHMYTGVDELMAAAHPYINMGYCLTFAFGFVLLPPLVCVLSHSCSTTVACNKHGV